MIAAKVGSVFLVFLVVLALIWQFGMYTRVTAGSACVLLRHGAVQSTVGPGKHFDPPWGTTFECSETRWKIAQVGDTPGKSDYVADPVTTQTSDGVTITIQAQFRYATPRESLATLYTEGARDADQVWNRVVQKEAQASIQVIANTTPVRAIYLEGRAEASKKMQDELKSRLDRFGISLDSFTLITVDPPQEYKDNIAQQQDQIEAAELERARSETIQVQNDNKKLAAQGDADASLITAQGEAKSNDVIAASLTGHPELLWQQYYQALATANWAILSPSDVQPTTPLPPVSTPAS